MKRRQAALSAAMRFILIRGVVSLFSDITREGVASILGDYLSIAGASAAAIRFASGPGEFVGYSLRLVTGYIADKTKKYWPMTIIGYLVDCLAVPALALVTLITMHTARVQFLPGNTLPLLYAGAMITDTAAALFFGWLYDKFGIRVPMFSILLAAPFFIFVFAASSRWALYMGAALWGIGMGAHSHADRRKTGAHSSNARARRPRRKMTRAKVFARAIFDFYRIAIA